MKISSCFQSNCPCLCFPVIMWPVWFLLTLITWCMASLPHISPNITQHRMTSTTMEDRWIPSWCIWLQGSISTSLVIIIMSRASFWIRWSNHGVVAIFWPPSLRISLPPSEECITVSNHPGWPENFPGLALKVPRPRVSLVLVHGDSCSPFF